MKLVVVELADSVKELVGQVWVESVVLLAVVVEDQLGLHCQRPQRP